jgi:hypothetical protein
MAEEIENKREAEDFVAGANKVISKAPQIIAVGSKVYTIKQPRKFARAKIDKLNQEAWWCEQQMKKPLSLKQAQKISKRMSTLHAKTAALYLLGLKALIPFAFAIKWRLLMLKYDEVIAYINNAGHTGDAQVNFSLANWDITRVQLARSMSLIGDGLKELEQRMASARKQALEDATKKKADNK